MANSLQAVLNRAKSQSEEQKPEAVNETAPTRKKPARKSDKQGRANTVLIGGHFPPEVSKQLRILAAEEGTTNQALLEEALDLLFMKKGKGHIADL